MKIVFMKTAKGIGKVGEEKDVKKGYALNFLIPNGFVLPATEGNIKEAKNRARKFEKAVAVDNSIMEQFIKEIERVELVVKTKANEKGNLFASLKAEDIAEEIAKKLSKSIDSKHIVLKEPIKKVGEYEVRIETGENKGVLKIKVEAEK